jgi:hypothetical protein
MDYMQIRTVSEADFDAVINDAGGARLATDGSADYLLNEAVIELKLVNEEGFDKPTRQAKIAKLFRENQSTAPIVIVNPNLLDEAGLRTYYNIVEGPIKTCVKKAAFQLDETAKRYNPQPARVLVILNIGYTALSHEEFKAVCLKCVRNDTTKIDWLICGGIYYHSDKWDNYIFEMFEGIPVNVARSFPSFAVLLESWKKFGERLAIDAARGEIPKQGKMPVLDLSFEIGGIRFIKPSPKVPSNMDWPSGRPPRINTSGIDKCPPVAITFPDLSEEDWAIFRQIPGLAGKLKLTFGSWLAFQKQQDERVGETLKPFVPVQIRYEEFENGNEKPKEEWLFSDLCEFANSRFDQRTRDVLDSVKEKDEMSIVPLEYIHVVIREIGEDEANDLSSAYFISETPGFERKETIFENERMFFKYAIVLATAYAVKRGVDVVVFSKITASALAC